jgi:hypothetical protein
VLVWDERTLHTGRARIDRINGATACFCPTTSDGCARKRTRISTFLPNSRGRCQGSAARAGRLQDA